MVLPDFNHLLWASEQCQREIQLFVNMFKWKPLRIWVWSNIGFTWTFIRMCLWRLTWEIIRGSEFVSCSSHTHDERDRHLVALQGKTRWRLSTSLRNSIHHDSRCHRWSEKSASASWRSKRGRKKRHCVSSFPPGVTKPISQHDARSTGSLSQSMSAHAAYTKNDPCDIVHC